MADQRRNIGGEEDLEPDFVPVSRKETFDTITPKYGRKNVDNADNRLVSMDSGICFSSSLNLSSLRQTDKSPIQCTDSEIEDKFSKLNVADDEGISMPNLKLCNNDNSVNSPGSVVPETSEIEVDLTEQDCDGDTVIHMAIVNLMPEVALALISICDDVECLNIQNYLLQSPLHLAVLTGQVQIVKALIEAGVDVTTRDQQGNSPLHIACRKGDRDSVSMIVQSFDNNIMRRKKHFTLTNCEGLTCVHVAAQQKEFIILGHLFSKGADVNVGDAKSGRTMLHYAVENNDIETVKLLLTHPEIDVECKTFKGETPLVLAYWRNYQDVLKRLRLKGACFSYDLVEESDDETFP